MVNNNRWFDRGYLVLAAQQMILPTTIRGWATTITSVIVLSGLVGTGALQAMEFVADKVVDQKMQAYQQRTEKSLNEMEARGIKLKLLELRSVENPTQRHKAIIKAYEDELKELK